ncbi:MAG: hypothetical protein GC185_02520 [Alphaproteobacteria bacterium]|nr:hypothetical protein [Alphaproteobacteria bacterium]
MTKVEQFESIFRAAIKDNFEYHKVSIHKVLVVIDRSEKDAQEYLAALRRFLSALGPGVSWEVFNNKAKFTPLELLNKVEEVGPGLICTYRNLHSNAWKLPYSLGEHLDVLLQKTQVPVMVLPHPDEEQVYDHAMEGTENVMALTDQLSNDHRLVNYAAAFTAPGGKLFLSHIEDQRTFERYMNAISKIPDIPTEMAEKEIRARLLKDPKDYIESCAKVLGEEGLPVEVETCVDFGHRISEYKGLIRKNRIDLLVMNAKDNEQLAMHGMAYPLAIELRHIPLMFL